MSVAHLHTQQVINQITFSAVQTGVHSHPLTGRLSTELVSAFWRPLVPTSVWFILLRRYTFLIKIVFLIKRHLYRDNRDLWKTSFSLRHFRYGEKFQCKVSIREVDQVINALSSQVYQEIACQNYEFSWGFFLQVIEDYVADISCETLTFLLVLFAFQNLDKSGKDGQRFQMYDWWNFPCEIGLQMVICMCSFFCLL